MKNINFQVKFHVFCMFEKSLFYTNSCEPGGVNCRPHYQNVPNAKSERAVREGHQRGPPGRTLYIEIGNLVTYTALANYLFPYIILHIILFTMDPISVSVASIGKHMEPSV